MALAQLVLFGVVTSPEDLMNPVLRRMDELLDDEALIDQVVAAQRSRFPKSGRRGRYGTPAEVVLRLLVLKHIKSWSYEQLEWEVTGNVVYRRFCRIDGTKVPDAKTMIRQNKLLEGPALRALFDRVVGISVEKKATRGRKMRIDTTVVEAPIRYPTDSGLLEDAVRVVYRNMRRLIDAGIKLPSKLVDVGRSVTRRCNEIKQALRKKGDEAREAIKKPYRRLLRITGRLVRQAGKAVDAARSQMKSLGEQAQQKAARVVGKLETILPRAQQVIRQTRARIVRGVTNSSGKLISIFETYAQILRRGKLHRPTEFGNLVKVQEAENGIITDIGVVPEKQDSPLLVPAVERHIEVFGRAPKVAATDRGFHSGKGERRIKKLGVHHAAIPKPGHRSPKRIAYERQRWFKRARAWRAGGEARIARLKNHFGMLRSPYRGAGGTERTALWAGIANNLVAVAAQER
jgi:IS5 family transposase